jgi:TolB-like protein/Flp pilus assembly protein TadD
MTGRSFFSELKRRKVVQTAAIYGAVAWGVTEVAVTVVEQLFLPQWVSTLAVIGFVVGFPVAMFLAWTFDLTREGLQRTTINSRRGKTSIAVSLLLLVAGTAGLFFLIRPSLETREADTVAVGIMPNSIAVLPFENLGLDAKNSYLGDVLSDELRDQLGRIPGLRVAARSSSIAVMERAADAKSVSGQLGVALIVEGRLRQQGQKLSVSVQLIEGSTGLSLWSESFERDPRELLLLQQAIAEPIVRLALPGAEDIVAEPATRNVSANELMLLARHYEQIVRDKQEVDAETLNQAIRLYSEAIVADPNSALAQSRLAGALLYAGDLESAEAPIFKALTLDPNLSEVQHTLGLYYYVRGLPGAGAAFKRAVELNPNNPDALENYGKWIWVQGKTEGVAELFRRSVELDPLSLARHGLLGAFLALEATTQDALEVIVKVEELFDGPEAYRRIGELREYIGQVDQAIAWTIRARDLEPGNEDHRGRLAELYAVIGDFDTALTLEPVPGLALLYRMRRYQDLIEIGEFLVIEQPQDMVARQLLAFAYTATGQFELALRMLQSTGLPGSVFEGVRSSRDIEGFVMLMDATYGAGIIDIAVDLAKFWVNRDVAVSVDWWRDVLQTCGYSVLGNHDEVLNRLVRIRQSPRLPIDSVLKDSVCFAAYAENPEYMETLHLLEERKKALRDRLPATLAEFGVKL